MDITQRLADFIAIANRRWGCSEWISDDTMEVYVRKGYHVVSPNSGHWFLDIANITVYNPGQGLFSTKFLPLAVELNPWDGIYVECVHNPRFANWLRRNNWTEIGEGAPSFYKMRDKHEA